MHSTTNRTIQQNQRTLQQNKSLHKYFELLAETLNEAGYDMKKTLKQDAEIPWSPQLVKDFLWRPIQEAALQKESTTELTTKDVDIVWDILNRHLGDKLGVYVPLPSIETLDEEQRNERAQRHTG